MDVATLLSYVPLLMKFGPVVKQVLDMASSNSDIVSLLKKEAAPIVGLLEQMGASLFPKAAPAIHLVGGAVAAFDPNVTKWLQGACNSILGLTPALEIDGIYGPLTRDAVMKVQQKLGLDKVDGLAGQVTRAAIDMFFAKAAPAAAA